MCQVSSGELGLLDRHIDLGIDSIECPLEWAVDGAEGRKRGGEAWAQQTVVVPRDNQGETAASIRMRMRRGGADGARA